MEVIGFILMLLLVIAFGVLCYFKWELKEMGNSLKIIELHHEIIDNYERRIKIMQELIDYNENVIGDAMSMSGNWKHKKAMEHIEEYYVIWDEIQYEEMEKCDCDECFSRDEHEYNDIWGDD